MDGVAGCGDHQRHESAQGATPVGARASAVEACDRHFRHRGGRGGRGGHQSAGSLLRHGTTQDAAGLDLVWTAGTLVAVIGGFITLLLAALRQRSTELTLEHQRELAATAAQTPLTNVSPSSTPSLK